MFSIHQFWIIGFYVFLAKGFGRGVLPYHRVNGGSCLSFIYLCLRAKIHTMHAYFHVHFISRSLLNRFIRTLTHSKRDATATPHVHINAPRRALRNASDGVRRPTSHNRARARRKRPRSEAAQRGTEQRCALRACACVQCVLYCGVWWWRVGVRYGVMGVWGLGLGYGKRTCLLIDHLRPPLY